MKIFNWRQNKQTPSVKHLLDSFVSCVQSSELNNSSKIWRSTHQVSHLYTNTHTHTRSNRRTSESAFTATTPFTTLWWIGRRLGVLTRASNPQLCLLKSEVVWMGNGAGWLKRGPLDGSYQANRETGERENEWERKECWGCHWLVDCNQSTKCERGIDPSLRSDKQTADGGHPVHV